MNLQESDIAGLVSTVRSSDPWSDAMEESSLKLLKLYKLYPSHVCGDTVARVLIRALCSLPGHGLQLCLCLVPEKVSTLDKIQAVTTLARMLEGCDFPSFWASLSDTETLSKCPELSEENAPFLRRSVRRFAAGVITGTFKVVAAAQAAAFLGCSEEELAQSVAQEFGWKVEAGLVNIEVEILPPRPKNVNRKVNNEEQLTKILSAGQVA